jgi:hypothetical protein
MKINYNSYNPIIIQFPRFAGGKFISNCLALSKHAVPQHSTMAKYLLDNSIFEKSKFLSAMAKLYEQLGMMILTLN